MSRHFIAVAFTVALLAAAGFALAQSGPVEQPPPLPVIRVPPATPTAPGRYAIVQAGKSALLLVDTATGKTWELERGSTGAAWLPVNRLDDDKAAQKWRAAARAEGGVSEEQAARHAREVEALRQALDEVRRVAAPTGEQAERALLEAEQRLLKLQRQKAKDQQK